MALKTAYDSTVIDRLRSAVTMERIVWVIIGFGVLVRLAQFMANSSLWVDEAGLAVSIVGRPYSELANQLEFNTGSPIGYLVLAKFSTQIFGSGERALRLVSLLFGIGSLFLILAVARHYVRPSAMPLAIIMLAASTSMVRYSAFVKQYSSDVFIALLIMLVQTFTMRSGLALRWLITYSVVGAVAIWFSHPSVFILAGMGGVMGIHYALQRDWRQVLKVAVMSGVWVLSLLASFELTTVGDLAANSGIRQNFSDNLWFAPFPPTSIAEIQWYPESLLKLLDVPVGLPLAGLATLLLLVGGRAIFIKDRYKFFLLVSPIAVTFLASAAHLYPFADRWIIFLAPLIFIFVAEGAMSIHALTRNATPFIGIALIGILLFHPLASEALHLVEPRGTEEIRPVLVHVQNQREDGDGLYIYPGSVKALTYYAVRLGISEDEYKIGANYVFEGSISPRAGNWERLDTITSELAEFKGNNRVWVVFSNVRSRFGLNDEAVILRYLDDVGTRVETFRVERAAAYLYDLSGSQASNLGATPSGG